MRFWSLQVWFASGLCLLATSALPAEQCSNLSTLKLPEATITLAEVVPAGTFAMPPGMPMGRPVDFKTLPAFCRVVVTSRPTTDSEIKFEVWLPTSSWNGKFEGTGNGGWLGQIIYPALADGVRRGYAVANTDTGHTSGLMDGSWALGHPEKIVDFGYRAVHLMTVRGKDITEAFFGKPPKYSYWNGCSSGGKQGLKEAQQFPEDYDGIVAGAPANYWTHLTAASVWMGLQALKTKESYIPAEKFRLLHKAVIEACDALDGLKDGLIDDPRKCRFDPAVLQCQGAETSACLTVAQVETAGKIYGPATTAQGVKFFPGLQPGSELGWGFLLGGPDPTRIGSDYYTYVLHKDAHWNPRSLDFDKEVPEADKLDHGTVNAIDPDLHKFKAHGGKLVMYHGWTDALIPSQNSVNYYESVVQAMGGPGQTTDFFRLFMVPGMDHCFGGEGLNAFDSLRAVEQWVEDGKAPDRIVASHMSTGKVDRTRPLCVYPKVAKYQGQGSIDEAANFTCSDPR